MKTQVTQPVQAGSIVRRVREDQGISRAELSRLAKVSPRTLFAFEQGENENLGLAGFLRVTAALGLVVSLDDGASPTPGQTAAAGRGADVFAPKWDRLGDVWSLEGEVK
ncbi:MAG: helix-turn-helix domain-containing protein [Coriobacteriia bacterium]|nr:helix-turn-helix domain-containing protein [Coriobacteriia bacterium]